MEETVTTILFDGRFWIALIEKTGPQGEVRVGKYTFGPEPSNQVLLNFMLHIFQSVPVYPGGGGLREKKARNIREQERSASRSKDIYKELHQAFLAERKKQVRREELVLKEEQYRLKQEKKKEKKRGR